MFAHACKVGLEAVVSKVRDSIYPTGRSNDWVKKTCAQRETLTIARFALDGSKWDGLYVGRRKGGDLVYACKVDHGFDKASAADLRKRLECAEDASVLEARRAQGHLGRAEAEGRDRVPGEVG
jgi:bifunctional non-homologous end joining protein LigD